MCINAVWKRLHARVCVFPCMRVFLCVCMWVSMFICAFVCLCDACMQVSMYICIHKCVCAFDCTVAPRLYLSLYKCVCVCIWVLCVYIIVCMCLCVCFCMAACVCLSVHVCMSLQWCMFFFTVDVMVRHSLWYEQKETWLHKYRPQSKTNIDSICDTYVSLPRGRVHPWAQR